MLTALTFSATLFVGLTRGPWWCWLIGGAALAFLSITDPQHLRPSLADASLSDALSLLRADLVCLSAGCGAAAVAFGMGRALSWVLPI